MRLRGWRGGSRLVRSRGLEIGTRVVEWVGGERARMMAGFVRGEECGLQDSDACAGGESRSMLLARYCVWAAISRWGRDIPACLHGEYIEIDSIHVCTNPE